MLIVFASEMAHRFLEIHPTNSKICIHFLFFYDLLAMFFYADTIYNDLILKSK
jgi:hypothetical protein